MKKELEAVVGLRDDDDLEHGHWHIAELLAPEGAMVSGGAKGGASRGPSPPNISHQDFFTTIAFIIFIYIKRKNITICLSYIPINIF
jgi:hypothetical protein